MPELIIKRVLDYDGYKRINFITLELILLL